MSKLNQAKAIIRRVSDIDLQLETIDEILSLRCRLTLQVGYTVEQEEGSSVKFVPQAFVLPGTDPRLVLESFKKRLEKDRDALEGELEALYHDQGAS